MSQALALLGWIALGFVLGMGFVAYWIRRARHADGATAREPVAKIVEELLAADPREYVVRSREFPRRVRTDLQRGIDALIGDDLRLVRFLGLHKEYSHDGIGIEDCLSASMHDPAVVAAPEYEDVDVGDTAPVRCLKRGLWVLDAPGG